MEIKCSISYGISGNWFFGFFFFAEQASSIFTSGDILICSPWS